MTNESLAKLAHNFVCKSCDYICSRSNDYTKHLLTAKHIRLFNTNKNTQEIAKVYKCICGNEYKHNPSLYKHKKTCIEITNLNYKNKIIEDLMKQNNELKELIIEQKDLIIEQKEEKQELKEVIIVQCGHSKKLLDIAIEQQYLAKDQAEEQQEHNKKVLELAQEQKELAQEQKEIALEQKELTIEQNENQKELMKQINEKGLGTTINNNQNNQFNLNFFLNDTCKDAMNLTDFYKVIKDFKMPHPLILAFEKTKHPIGISNCIDAIMDSVPINKRPIHCSDLKREVMHYKENDIWEKEKELITPLEKSLLNHFRNKCNDELLFYKQNFMDIKNNEQDEDRYNRMCIHTFFGGDASETIKIKSRLAKTTCIVREKDALVPS